MSGSSLPAFPPTGKYIQAIRESCRALRTTSNIKIERSTIERLLLSPSFTGSFQRLSKAHGLAFPLQFPSIISELNLLSILSLLNFASGYRVPLHEQTGRGAWDNIRALVFSLYISSSSGADSDFLSAEGMQTIGMQTIAEQLHVSMHVERPHESIPGVTVGELGGPMHQLVLLITRTLNETGNILVKAGYPDLGTFVLEVLNTGKKAAKGGPPDVDTVLEHIVKTIPGFRDMAIVNGQPVYCFKKALFLLCAIEIRFGSLKSSSIPVPKTSSLPVFSDNVLPSMLIHLGVLDLSSASASLDTAFSDRSGDYRKLLTKAEVQNDVVARLPKEPPAEGPALSVDQAYILRAAAINACEIIVEVAHTLNESTIEASGAPPETLRWMQGITLQDVDMWLWSAAKDRPDYRRLERFSLRGTVMF
ncbi:hypothetical protein EW145_g3165 [Phellinidium pouzarii]|uniref:Queuosine 5'-phosphate N-glycosylase/hydrolase n=1 Tax=Phellinidium pouzarii TaxID=167371 RepID=A0A4S4L8E1_9AGAM|nr:hypothetical protein EW145_g3165 [Phellinidium pouzarii]